MSIPASVPPPAAPGFQSKGRARAAANHKKYGTPLPILLPESPLYAAALASPPANSTVVRLGLFSSARAIVPTVVGVLDRASQSVRVSDAEDMRLLFERGFFGKGALSRSEPSWRAGRAELLKGGSAANAEKIREQRRKERKQFKIDRAAAMREAAIRAEAVVAAKKAGEGTPGPGTGTPGAETPGTPGEKETTRGTPTETEGAEGVDVNALTPQTFLVRPTRPDANRNRGKKAFRRKPAASPAAGAPGQGPAGQAGQTAGEAGEKAVPPPTEEELAAQAAEREAERARREEERAREAALDEEVSALVEEREHLQLSYPEALFLAALGVLKIHDPEEVRSAAGAADLRTPWCRLAGR